MKSVSVHDAYRDDQTPQRLPVTNIGTSLMRSASGHDAYREDQTLQGLPVINIGTKRSMRPNEWPKGSRELKSQWRI